MKSMKRLNNQGGQAMVEMVLLAAMGVFLTVTVSNLLRSSDFASNLIAKPWNNLSGMIECGVWAPCGSQNKGMHPATSERNLSLRPD